MAESYLSPIRHVIPLVTIRRERRLPTPGTATVRLNEKVQAQDVVLESHGPSRHRFLDLARGLGLPDSEVARHLTHREGDRVSSGDVLAGPVGLGRRVMRAPADGRVIGLWRGRLLFEILGDPFTVRAGLPGLVVGSDGSQSVVIETAGALIQAAWGNGRMDYGVMRLVGDGPGDRVQTNKLDISLRGAVLVAGICDHPAPLHQATELSARGMILGSLAADLIPVVRRLPYPVVVTEGFGRVPINAPTYALLSTNLGREVSVDGQTADAYRNLRPEVIIPLPAGAQTDLPEEVVALKIGVRVRVVRQPHQGAVGSVRQISTRASHFPSGVLARSATVDLEGIGLTSVALANLELLH
jgi:hypothetical protein